MVRIAGFLAMLAAFGSVYAQQSPPPVRTGEIWVDGRVAVHSLTSLSDGHLQKIADVYSILAETADARSAQWDRIHKPLERAGQVLVPAVHWFALPNGSYWTVNSGPAGASLLDRPYFHRVVDGESVIGSLVVSHSTHRNTAIVAVPVRAPDSTVVGVLGASVYLDSLSLILRRQMGDPADSLLFFAIDSEPLGAVHSDSSLIFTEPMKLGGEDMRSAFSEMLSGEQGTVSYRFRGRTRIIQYLKSTVTGWWYGFGVVER